MKPHKIRYWLHSPEKSENPQTFAAKVNEICSLYLASTDLMEENTCVVSTDEMTGVQALEHKYPDKLPLPGQTARMEFEYIRHGTTSLIGFFEVATGEDIPALFKRTGEGSAISVKQYARQWKLHRRKTGSLFVTA